MKMQKFSLIFATILALAGTACGRNPDADRELSTKSEYSVLQAFEFDYRQREQEQPYLIEKNALSSDYDLIGLPIAGSERGYVWLIANPSGAPAIKQIPSKADFAISRDVLDAIEKSAQLSPAVRSYLLAHVGS